jgi:hypothetical protein
MKKTSIIIMLLLSSAILSARINKPETSDRRGFSIGIAAGGGVLLENDSEARMKTYPKYSLLNLKTGWMMTPRTALWLHVTSGGHVDNSETRAFEAVLATGQHWFTEKVWGMTGLGMAMDMPPFYETENDAPRMYFGFAASMTGGYEILRKGRFAMDVQTRILYGNYMVEENRRQSAAVDLLLGCNWYGRRK